MQPYRTEEPSPNRLPLKTNLKAPNADVECAEALCGLYELLNEYAPPWYSEGQNRRVRRILKRLGKV